LHTGCVGGLTLTGRDVRPVFLYRKQGKTAHAFFDEENRKDGEQDGDDSFFGHVGLWLLAGFFKGGRFACWRCFPSQTFRKGTDSSNIDLYYASIVPNA